LIDGNGTTAVENKGLIVKNDIVMPAAAVDGCEPGQVETVYFKNCTVLPCLIDCHVHLVMSGTGDPEIRSAQLGADYEFAAGAIESHLLKQRVYGVMAVRDGGDRYGHARRYKIECHHGPQSYPLVKIVGKGWKKPGRYGGLVARDLADGSVLGREVEAEEEGIDFVKIINSGLNSLTCFGKETPPQFDVEELRGAYEAALKRGLKVMVHANGEKAVRTALEAGCHSIEHGFFMGRDNLKRMADNQIVWVPTAFTMQAYANFYKKDSIEADTCLKNLDHQCEQIAIAKEQGVAVAAGTDAGSLWTHHGESIIGELGLLVEAGYSIEAAIASCAGNGARLLGLRNSGTLSPGRQASFIVTAGAPSDLPESLNAIVVVYLDGEPVSGRTSPQTKRDS